MLEIAILLEGESIQKTFHNSLALAKMAEACHYKRIWFAEHHNSDSVGSNAPTLLIGYVAENTETIRVGSGGIMLPNYSPLVVAEQFGTLAHLYPDRIDLGLGRASGTDQPTAQAIRSDFMTAVHSFQGELAKLETYFSLDNKAANVRTPIAEGTDVPLYILGTSTDSAHLAAKKGLPYAFGSHVATTYLLDALKIYRQEFQPSSSLPEPYAMAGVNVYVADTDEEAERLFTSMISLFVAWMTGSRPPMAPPTEMTDELRNLFHYSGIHQILKYSFVGSKQTVKSKVQAFLEQTGVNELIAASAMYDITARLKSAQLFAEIMDELNEEKNQAGSPLLHNPLLV